MNQIAPPPINLPRLVARFDRLAQFTLPGQAWTRRAFSPLFLEARAWLQGELQAAGLAVRLDAGGNLIGRREGIGPDLRPIITGSHCDTVVEGGRYDGILGVLAAIEVAQVMQEQQLTLAHPLEIIDFLSEEPSDYGISCVGSRAFSGLLDATMLTAKNALGETLAEGLRRIGGDPDQLTGPLRPAGSTAAFVELHIEQGPVLETRGLPIGVVTNIVGIRRVLILVNGRPDHAGTTPMDIRCDALVGAARIIEAVHRRAVAMSAGPNYVVATIGRIAMTPNVPNAVPGRVEMMLEVRSDHDAILGQFPELVIAEMAEDMTALRLSVEIRPVSRSKPTDCQDLVMDQVEQAARSLGYASMRMPSGAGHDGVYVAPTGPIGMIFIPCLHGRSHCPEEAISESQLLDGTRTLYQTLIGLDRHLMTLV